MFADIFINATEPSDIYTLSLHDALPISSGGTPTARPWPFSSCCRSCSGPRRCVRVTRSRRSTTSRSEEHTSELQSHSDLVCRLLLEKKKKKKNNYCKQTQNTQVNTYINI